VITSSTRADAERAQREVQSLGPGAHADGVLDAAVGGELALESLHLLAQHVPAAVEHPAYRRVDSPRWARACSPGLAQEDHDSTLTSGTCTIHWPPRSL
jgi:hypothetical protein